MAQFYTRTFRLPKSLIRFSSLIEDCVGASFCLDDRDIRWLQLFNGGKDIMRPITEDEMELMMSEYEKLASEKQTHTRVRLLIISIMS